MSSVAHLYMKLHKINADGEQIKGESVSQGYTGQIELEDWSWALARNKGGDDSSTDAAEPSVFAFSKRMDCATTAMLSAARAGTLLHATVTLEDDSSDTDFELIITLDKIRILMYDLSAQQESNSGQIEENWEFTYESITLDYKPANTTRTKAGAISVKLDRSPAASTASPTTDASKFIAMAESFSEQDLNGHWKTIQTAAQKRTAAAGKGTH